MNFPSNIHYDGKIIREMGSVPHWNKTQQTMHHVHITGNVPYVYMCFEHEHEYNVIQYSVVQHTTMKLNYSLHVSYLQIIVKRDL